VRGGDPFKPRLAPAPAWRTLLRGNDLRPHPDTKVGSRPPAGRPVESGMHLASMSDTI